MTYARPSKYPIPRDPLKDYEEKFLSDLRHRNLVYDTVRQGGWKLVVADYLRYMKLLFIPMVIIGLLMTVFFDSETAQNIGTPVVLCGLLSASLFFAWFGVARLHFKRRGWIVTGLLLAAVTTTIMASAIRL